MTTIAWDGESLASDQQCTDDNFRWRCYKILRTFDGRLIGACGDSSVCNLAMTWIEHGGDAPKPMQDNAEWTALEITRDGRVWLHDRFARDQVREPQFAIGSGSAYAMAAMHCGKDAVEAIQVASRFDPSTGLGYDVLRLKANA